jgi:serine protease Do
MNINLNPTTVFLAALLAVFVTVFSFPAAAESGFTGMQIQGMSKKIAEALGRKSADGVLVRDIALGGPADKSGIKRGDLIIKYAGKDIDSFQTMVKSAGSTRPGQSVKVSLVRNGKPMTLSMKLGKWTQPWRITKNVVASLPVAGLTLAALTQKLRKGLGLRWSAIGVVVTLVDPDRTDIGLRRGDLIVQVNQDEVWLPGQVVEKYKATKKAGRKELLLLVERINGFYFMPLPVK